MKYVKSKQRRIFILFLLFVILLIWLLIPQYYEDRSEFDTPTSSIEAGKFDYISLKQKDNKNQPLILLWTEFFDYSIMERLPVSLDCPYKCQYTQDRLKAKEAAVQVFHARDFFYLNRPPDNQALNVYFSMESPTFTHFWSPLFGLGTNVPYDYFNMSMTYRSNADIYVPYDMFIELDGLEKVDDVWTNEQVNKHVSQKSRPLLAAISNCDYEGGRLLYLKELQKHVNITLVGKCFDAECDWECLDKKIDDHHFFLAFENSICPEYVTEKFWRIKKLIVPIVLSRGVMPKHIPGDSYIAASDFESPEKLARYLVKLMSDKESYKSFFDWTHKYKRSKVEENQFQPLCHLCKLSTISQIKWHKNYKQDWSPRECIPDYANRLLKNDPALRADENQMRALVNRTGRLRQIGRVI